MLRVGVLASGRGSNLAALLDAQVKGTLEAEVTMVISDRPEARALDVAAEHCVEAHTVPVDGSNADAQEAKVIRHLQDAGIGLVVLAGYMRVLSPTFIQAFPGRIINIHPSLLPAFPGLRAQRQAIERGVPIAGCTTHFVAEEVDAGPIILQAALAVAPDDDEASLSNRILALEHQVLPATVRLFAEGRLSVEGARVRVKGARTIERNITAPGGWAT